MAAGELSIARLLDLAATELRLEVDYPASQLQDRVTLRLQDGLNDEQLWSLVNRLLQTRGFATIRAPGSDAITVVRAQEAAALSGLTPGPDALGPDAAGYLRLIYEPAHQDPAGLASSIAPLLTRSVGSSQVLGDAGLLLISDYSARVREVIDLLDRIDAPATSIALDRYEPSHLKASELASLASNLLSRRAALAGRGGSADLIESPTTGVLLVLGRRGEIQEAFDVLRMLDQAEAVEQRIYVPEMFSVQDVASLITQALDEEVRGSRFDVVVDTLTGSLLVTATPTAHEEIAALITRLDETPADSRRSSRSIVVKNRPIEELTSTLQSLIDAGALEASADGADADTNGPLDPAIGSPETKASELRPLVIQPDPATNKLLAIGEPRLLDQLERLVADLDVRQAQVMVEAMIISLDDSESLDLGIELTQSLQDGETTTELASLFGLGSGAATGGLTTGTGFTASIVNPGDFSVLIRALEAMNDGRSLSRPSILVNNNQSGTLDSVVQEPFTSTNVLNTTATTSLGGTSDAGTSISVTPQIAEGDHLVLEYTVSVSSFVGESSAPELPPPRQQNQLSSFVTVPDGYTVVLGGFELTTDSEATTRIPLLGSLPLIGQLFRSDSESETRTRFYVFITANVMRRTDFEDLKYFSDTLADETGIADDTGWPVIQPRVIR
ncbi:MAG: secretin N-terminal domain-containing protein [Planctomycetota bacterium]